MNTNTTSTNTATTNTISARNLWVYGDNGECILPRTPYGEPDFEEVHPAASRVYLRSPMPGVYLVGDNYWDIPRSVTLPRFVQIFRDLVEPLPEAVRQAIREGCMKYLAEDDSNPSLDEEGNVVCYAGHMEFDQNGCHDSGVRVWNPTAWPQGPDWETVWGKSGERH